VKKTYWEPGSRLRSTLTSAAPLVSNGFSAVANTAAVFALSTSAGVDFPTFAASTAALILAHGTATSLLGEPLMLAQRDRQTGSATAFPTIGGWVSMSLAVGTILGVAAALGLRIAGVQGVGWVTLAAISAFIFNDAARNLCFARGSSWTAAIADSSLAVGTLTVWAVVSRFDPYQVYWLWLVGRAIAGVLMTSATVAQIRASGDGSGLVPDIRVIQWARSGWSRTRWLAAEAVATTAAITLPLILAADEVAGPGRLLLSWFGFQQILFFAAYAVATRSGMKAFRTALILFCAGAAGAVTVGAIITLSPDDVLVKLFGPSAIQAQRWALWFGVLQLFTAAGNAAALGARLISGQQVETATKLFRGRLLFAAVSTIAGVIGALTIGLAGYIAGSALGAALHVLVSIWILRWPSQRPVGRDG
jgi:hypothetical protein